MATGHDEDILLGTDDDRSSTDSKQIMGALSKLQNTMDCVANGINTMGSAFKTLAEANTKINDQPHSSKRTAEKMEEGERDDDDDDDDILDYDDTDEVMSLLNSNQTKDAQQSSSKDGSLFNEMESLLEDDDDVGPAVSEKLASITNKAFSKQLAIEAVKKKKEAHRRPKNCEKVIVPRVNKEIWRQMQKQNFTKKRDLRLMNIQSAVTKSTCAILNVAQSLLNKDSEKHGEDIKHCLDAIYLLGHTNTALSMQRRELLRPVLKSDHAGLCDSNIPVTSLLFGDDLPKSLKEVRQVENVGRDYPSKNGKRFGYKPRNDYWKKKNLSHQNQSQKKFKK
ncbi:hypothetical protein FSP39_018857 [Pinctada imbricata]|uniref:Uncharacterized protein n=1 Tax=Pinctada imbricata TaxID=66713 RepID=A0AA88YQZ7_PINIB|nr:hypothetical protein FSP39_018857 [Pinctada imbricata]